jgi:peptidase E
VGQIVVSGGAGFWSSPGRKLDRYALSLTGKQHPRVCCIATAMGDNAGFIQGFYEVFGRTCEPSHLSLFLPPFQPPAEVLADQDLIYVSGGSTSNLLAVWRLHGIDELLRAALDAGTVLYGSSAGAMCWYESGITDSLSFDGELNALTNGLGFLPGSHAPHFDEPARRPAFEAMVGSGALGDGVGVDENAAVHYVDGRIERVLAAVEGATASTVERTGPGEVRITPLDATPL